MRGLVAQIGAYRQQVSDQHHSGYVEPPDETGRLLGQVQPKHLFIAG